MIVADRLRIALLVRSLDYGGAEAQVAILANGLASAGHDVTLLIFYPGGALLDHLSSEVKVRCLEKTGRWDFAAFLGRLSKAFVEVQPDVLYAFLPVPNILSCLSRLRSPKPKLVWGVRVSNMDLARYDRIYGLTYWLERRLSSSPDLIIANSRAGRHYAVSRGFPDDDRFIVIPNGIDLSRFRADARLRAATRTEWGIRSNETLIGIVARLDPMKDYANFLEAASALSRRDPHLRFVSVGTGPAEYGQVLRQRSRALGLEGRIIWAGARGDLPAVYNALDVLVSSSAFGEGFSNVLGEAMACGVPCAATNVGDAREIVGDSGVVVPPRDSEALSAGIFNLLARVRAENGVLSANLRKRIAESFSSEVLVHRTQAALEAIA